MIAEHDFCVGADIDQQRHLRAQVRTFGQHHPRGIRAHMARGHTVVLSSSALTVQVEPVARFLGIQNVLGVTPMLNGHAFDYFLMQPDECTYLAWFRQSPARWDPRSCAPG